jgi:hypothetical protein
MHRNIYIVLAILSLVLTFVVWWMLVRADNIMQRVACLPMLGSQSTNCESEPRYATPLIVFMVFLVGGLLTGSLAFLAWLYSDHHAEHPGPAAQEALLYVEHTGMLVVRSTE